jgi:hypothetical protein
MPNHLAHRKAVREREFTPMRANLAGINVGRDRRSGSWLETRDSIGAFRRQRRRRSSPRAGRQGPSDTLSLRLKERVILERGAHP